MSHLYRCYNTDICVVAVINHGHMLRWLRPFELGVSQTVNMTDLMTIMMENEKIARQQ